MSTIQSLQSFLGCCEEGVIVGHSFLRRICKVAKYCKEDMAVSVAETMAYSAAVQEAFWPDRYLVNLALKAKVSRTVFYLVRIVQATQASVPQAYVLDLDRPSIQGLSADSGSLLFKMASICSMVSFTSR